MTRPTAQTPTGHWGLFDTVDELWMGNDEGPIRYDEEDISRIAAEVAARMLDWPATRIRARPFTGATRLRDELPAKRSALMVLRDIERGEI